MGGVLINIVVNLMIMTNIIKDSALLGDIDFIESSRSGPGQELAAIASVWALQGAFLKLLVF